MQGWRIYEIPNAQVAFDAVLAVEARYTPDEITSLAIISREGPDDRDHLYLCAASKNPPNGRIGGVEEFLEGFGRRCPYTIDDINGAGINFLGQRPRGVHPDSPPLAVSRRHRISAGPKAARGFTGPGDSRARSVQSSRGD